MNRFSILALSAALLWPLGARADSPDCVVVFNEIHYNPAGPSEDGEWIELFNQLGIMVDLSGWRLTGGIDYTFPEETFLAPGAYLVVAKTPAARQLGPFAGSLDNGGERLRLRNHSDRLMDEFDYGDNGPWSVVADGSGATLAKRRPYTANKPPENWTRSHELGGTPGAENFPSRGPAEGTLVRLLDVSATWRFHQSGLLAPADWAQQTHPAGAAGWESGPGPMAYEPSLAEPIGTPLRWPGDNSPYVVTYYFETEFTLTASQLTQLQTLDLRYLLDDGAVFYLNGVEAQRANMPGGLVAPSTFAESGVEAAWSPALTLPTDALVPGSNRLSVEVHQESMTSGDIVLGIELEALVTEVASRDLSALRLNELPPSGEAQSWIEIINTGSVPLEIGGAFLSVERDPLRAHPLPAQSLAAGETLLVSELEMGFRPSDQENVYLFSAAGTEVIDGQRVTERLRGRAQERNGAWLYPSAPTPGAPNRFSFRDDIVISEINYNPPPGGSAGPLPRSENQWIEIANRSLQAVDLSGWEFVDGISLSFPPNTILGAGEHACVAGNATLFRAAYPAARLLGEFQGNLSRRSERVVLRASDRNPVDEVRYFDGGRWPRHADGGGSSLELRDLESDNNVPEAWAASDEAHQTDWQSYSYRMRGTSNGGPDGAWRDFVIGLLDAGEILLDDIRVVESPESSATQFLANTSFESGATDWRMLGNHRHSKVITDPDNPGNKVLHLIAEGATEHMHNHIETTLMAGRTVSSSRTYEVSFRAKWLTGSNQLHTRLYFNRVAQTTPIARPLEVGTPSAPNSRAELNIGPTFTHFLHAPAVPDSNQAVTVTTTTHDPDGLTAVNLYYSVDERTFRRVGMTPLGAGDYQGTIPGQSSGRIVQFYVRGTDSLGAQAMFPALGPQSRAQYKVQDGKSSESGIHNFRIVMQDSDADFMHTPINVMSNGRIRATVIDREEEIYYDVGIRIKGGQRARLQDIYLGFNVRFGKERLYRGVHRTIGIDRSGSPNEAPTELMLDLAVSNSTGSPSRYNDLLHVIAPRDRHTGSSILQMARYSNVFLDSQYPNGSDGFLYEYELIYYPRTADANGFKIPEPDTVLGQDVGDLGPDKERYRWFFLTKNNRAADNFEPIIRYNQHFGKSGAAFEEGLEDVIDVDGWLRGFAYSAMSGAGDGIASGFEHNGMYYAQPDGRVISLPHDMDFGWNSGLSIWSNPECAKLTQDGRRRRIYLGHLHDIISTTWNQSYLRRWSTHLNSLDPAGYWSSTLSYMNSRSSSVLSQINSSIPPVDFEITTNDPLTVNGSAATISGKGWINVRTIHLAGNPAALAVNWIDESSWQVTVPSQPGPNTITLEVVDFSGRLIGSESIVVSNTGATEPATAANLAVTELMYHPLAPSASERASGFTDEAMFEYIEVMNISSMTIDLTGINFVQGIIFSFPSMTLSPMQRAVVARRRDAFLSRHPRAVATLVPGEYGIGSSNKLANGGEEIVLTAADGAEIRRFTYRDAFPWPASPDGQGPSLVLIAPVSDPDPTIASNWRPSITSGGIPGRSDALEFSGDPEADPDRNGLSAFFEHALGSSLPPVVPTVDLAGGTATMSFTRNLAADDVVFGIEVSPDLQQWTPGGAVRRSSIDNRDGTATERWTIPNVPLQTEQAWFLRLRLDQRTP